ncbi:MAG: response regulator [Rhodoferax sp.]|nr:response regulator [Rhodoferax sp.]MCF8208859.1 response regulator [Rhodoferax sp.]
MDDDPIKLEVAKLQMEALGLVCDVAVDGLGAVNLTQQQKYTVIFMGMQMPEMDGLTATRRIRELPGCQTTPIVASTANAFAQDKERWYSAGLDDFLSKPFIPNALYTTLLRWLGKVRTDTANP